MLPINTRVNSIVGEVGSTNGNRVYNIHVISRVCSNCFDIVSIKDIRVSYNPAIFVQVKAFEEQGKF